MASKNATSHPADGSDSSTEAPDTPSPASPTPLKILFFGDYFPRPNNPTMGTWALGQLQALAAEPGVTVRAISCTSWVPRWLGWISLGAKRRANCPATHQYGNVHVDYPRWPYYNVGPFRKLFTRDPGLMLHFAWPVVRNRVFRAIEAYRPDVVYIHHSLPSGFIGLQIHRRFGLPYVITDHSFDYIEACHRFPRRKKLFETVVRNADTVIAVARRMETQLQTLFPGIKTVTIQNGTHSIPQTILDHPRPADLRDKFVFFSCGFFYQRKCFPELIEAFAPVAARHPEAVLRIAGNGALRPLVEAKVSELRLQDRVQLLGMVDHATVLQEMAWSDAFVLIGYDEPFATVFSEAMSAAKPIITASDGGINDVFVSQTHGLAVPPRDVPAATEAMERLLSDPEFSHACGMAGKRLFDSTLRWASNAQRLLAIFRGALP
jgi:glycosyltransferase involved in cell wall biosynthesis